MVRHKNSYGYWEEIDRLPVPGCCCNKCLRAEQRDSDRAARRAENRRSKQSGRSFARDNGSVGGQSAYVQQQGDRTVGYFGRDHEGKIATNDGLNAEYLRDDEGNVTINYREDSDDDPYAGYNRFD